jgi:transposase
MGQTPIVRAHPQRDKVNFYGTLDLVTGTEIVTRAEKMNSAATAIHLQQILDTYSDKPILLFWDRATGHGGAAVKQILTDNPRLEVLKYPPAAPDLNPQEQVWKATRHHVSHNHDRSKLSQLAGSFEQFLRTNTFGYSFLEKYDINAIRAMYK